MTETTTAARPKWARWLTWVSLAIASVALVYTIHNLGLGTLIEYLGKIGWWWLAIVPMEVICTTLDATAIRFFASPDRPRLRKTLLAQLAGRAINSVTPAGNLGEAVKMSVLTEVVTPSRAVSSILLYNVVSFCVELLILALAVPFLAVLVPMPAGLKWGLIAAAVLCVVITLALYWLIQRGMVASVARLGVRLRLVSRARYERWEPKLVGVDDKMRFTSGARRRDRWIAILAVCGSRTNSMILSLMILHAVGESITATFVAAWIVGSFGIYFAATLVPMGFGISEGGYYGFYRALGENPARGVTLVLARRAVTIVYATIGLVLVTTNETVKRVRQRHHERARAFEPESAPAPRLAVGK